MAITVDDTTVARVTMSKIAGTGNPIVGTTASFTAPASSLLVVCIGTDTNTAGAQTLTMSNNGAALTWSTRVQRDDSDGSGGACFIARALVSAERTGLTVTASVAGHQIPSADDRGSFKVYIVTGHDTATPDGNTGEGSSTTNAVTVSAYTASGASGSRGFCSATDWNALGAPTSTDTEDAFTMTALSGMSIYKAADASSGASVTFNLDAPAGTPDWNWVAYEVLAAAGGGGAAVRPRSLLTLGCGC